jgi:hypothetical protein
MQRRDFLKTSVVMGSSPFVLAKIVPATEAPAETRIWEILAETEGRLRYWDQFQSICTEIGGFPAKESGDVLKAVLKQQTINTTRFGLRFVDHAAPMIGERRASRLWRQLEICHNTIIRRWHEQAFRLSGSRLPEGLRIAL